MLVSGKYWPVIFRGFKPLWQNRSLGEFDWFFPLDELLEGKLLFSEPFDAFEATWYLCISARKNMRGGLCLRQSLYRCPANRVPHFNLFAITFKLVNIEVPQLEEMNLRYITTPISRDGLYCNDIVEEPLSELRRRYSEKGIVCLRLNMHSRDPRPSTWDIVTDEEFFGLKSIEFDNKPTNMEHRRLEGGAREFPIEMVPENDEAGFSIEPSSDSQAEPIRIDPPKLESGAQKLPQEKVLENKNKSSINPSTDDDPIKEEPELESSARGSSREKILQNDEFKPRIEPRYDGEPINMEPPELEIGDRELPRIAPTELKSSSDPNCDDQLATKAAKRKGQIDIHFRILLLSLECVLVTAMLHSALSWIWASLDLMAFYVIYWGIYREATGKSTVTDENADLCFKCLTLTLFCSLFGVCYMSPFFFLAIYVLYTEVKAGNISFTNFRLFKASCERMRDSYESSGTYF